MRICANELNSDPSREDRVDSGKTQHTLHKSSTLQIQRHRQVKSIINEKDTQWNIKEKKAGVVALISDKVGSRARNMTKNKEGSFRVTRGPAPQRTQWS